MVRGKDRGKDFDDQYYGSKRAAEYKKSRGQGIYSQDAYLARAGQPKPDHRSGNGEGCGKKTVMLLGFLTGFGWVISEIIPRAF